MADELPHDAVEFATFQSSPDFVMDVKGINPRLALLFCVSSWKV